jgi:hypothetical protein
MPSVLCDRLHVKQQVLNQNEERVMIESITIALGLAAAALALFGTVTCAFCG